ncbi:MAG: hypothetical protein JNL39_13430 [Opitutaceae bacterium]|nr:hypothetical protein [Opitutaceae bacterium]
MSSSLSLMQVSAVIGYVVSAGLYFGAWLNPAWGMGPGLMKWVAFEKICLAEFLSIHAATLLAAVSLARASGEPGANFSFLFWGLLAFYATMAGGAYLFHRSFEVLAGFYLMLAIRGVQFFSLGTADVDELRAVVVKNFVMTVPMFLLVAGIAFGDDLFTPWQERFAKAASLWQRIVQGRALLIVTAYYLVWAVVELKWPQRISK